MFDGPEFVEANVGAGWKVAAPETTILAAVSVPFVRYALPVLSLTIKAHFHSGLDGDSTFAT